MPTIHEAQSTLERFLSAPERSEDCFDLDQYYGALTAVLSCPEFIRDGDLGALILGQEFRDDHAWFEDDQIYAARILCENELDEALALDRFDLHQLYSHPDTAQKPSEPFSRWCQGYLRGYMLTEEFWQEAFDFLAEEGLADTQDNHLGMLTLMVTMADWQVALADAEDPEKLAKGFVEAFDAINDGVKITYQLALLLEENRLQAEQERQPVVRSAPKIGRNDPCPCGSGKKYKKCCLLLETEAIDQ
jgi:uncharacterized protein